MRGPKTTLELQAKTTTTSTTGSTVESWAGVCYVTGVLAATTLRASSKWNRDVIEITHILSVPVLPNVALVEKTHRFVTGLRSFEFRTILNPFEQDRFLEIGLYELKGT
jgi:hypothetical protein